MLPEECERCGKEADELVETQMPNGDVLYWFICEDCQKEINENE